ncbi:hypothetical protein NIES4071_57140 [Calothrix sp. NIES-4071]|nr:hypothetical protein NIES4071_57140 [Calothrix sp. NIES-4071]BAZ60021.1 hypothetical protein NIES4105_57090 [Calothrix sp. NIES-4105]
MTKHTFSNDIQGLVNAQDLGYIVFDKREAKRANGAKRRRRYENRLLNYQTDNYSENLGSYCLHH